MKTASRSLFRSRIFLCILCGISAFALSIALVKSRQDIILVGRKICELERNLASYAAKNSELDAKILRLSAPEALRTVIIENGLVAMNKRNTIKISNAEANFYAMNHEKRALAKKFASENFPKQTNLTMSN